MRTRALLDTLAPGVNARDTAERETPARLATSAAVTNARRTDDWLTSNLGGCTRVQHDTLALRMPARLASAFRANISRDPNDRRATPYEGAGGGMMPAPGLSRQQTVVFTFDDRIALANPCFEPRAIEHFDVAASIVDQARFLQISGRLHNPLPPYAEHVGDQFLRHRQRSAIGPDLIAASDTVACPANDVDCRPRFAPSAQSTPACRAAADVAADRPDRIHV